MRRNPFFRFNRKNLAAPLGLKKIRDKYSEQLLLFEIGIAAVLIIRECITTDGSFLYVGEIGNFSIRRIDLQTLEVTTIAGSGGNSGYVDATGTAARFAQPQGIVTDGKSLYFPMPAIM